jgi:hypothetical protein
LSCLNNTWKFIDDDKLLDKFGFFKDSTFLMNDFGTNENRVQRGIDLKRTPNDAFIEEEKKEPREVSFPPLDNFNQQFIPIHKTEANVLKKNMRKDVFERFDDPEIEKKNKNKVFAKESRERKKRYIKELEKKVESLEIQMAKVGIILLFPVYLGSNRHFLIF